MSRARQHGVHAHDLHAPVARQRTRTAAETATTVPLGDGWGVQAVQEHLYRTPA
jgi:hypothetical protein